MKNMTFGLLILILSLSLAISCPPSLSPENRCECTVGEDENVHVTCLNIDDPAVLRSSIREFRGLNIHKLKIWNSNLNYVPHNLFRGMRVTYLEFQNSVIKNFSDTDIAFRGLGDSLFQLDIVGIDGLDTIDWSLFRKLRQLRKVRLHFSHMEAIRGVRTDVVSRLNLEEVRIDRCQLSKLSDDAFASFDYLFYIDIYNNNLREMKRSMLPNPANNLVLIVLRGNKLTTLPEDFFTNMPQLGVVALSSNYIRTLKEETFEPVWQQLWQFEATDTLLCDCKLKWILEKPTRSIMKLNVNCFDLEEGKFVSIANWISTSLQC